MLLRIEDGGISGTLKEKEYYLDKFVIFNADKYTFRTFLDKVKYVELSLSVLQETTICSEIKEYLVKMLSMVSSMKVLHRQSTVYDRNAYIEQLKSFRDNLDAEVLLEGPIYELHTPNQVTMEYYDSITMSETYRAREVREAKGIERPVVTEVCMALEEDCVCVTYPNALYEQYGGHICAIIENKTGNFHDDMFNELFVQIGRMKASMNIKEYKSTLTENGVNVEIASAFNYLIQASTYLVNSTSFRSSKLFGFDVFELERRLDMVKLFIEKAIRLEEYVNQ